jgi:sporulation protein YlmC with PRC-barrel domain
MIFLTSVNALNGKNVMGTSAVSMGEVEGAEFDPKTWQITDLRVKLNDDAVKQFGFKKHALSHVMILLPVGTVKAVGDVVSLSNSVEELKGIVKLMQQ